MDAAPSSARNLYRQRWAVTIGEPPAIPDKGAARISPIKILQRFPGGMAFLSGGRFHLLTEAVFDKAPFLLVFSLASSVTDVAGRERYGMPDSIMSAARRACEPALSALRLPENLHNVEVDMTRPVAARIKLPKGISLIKAILKIDIARGGGLACVCDVDGPCGYCCDTCETCYNCC